MPSAAKRRKAAKKKREKEANNNNASSTTTNNRSHVHDDPKSQSERDSDGGEVGSLASPDQQNHDHPFGEEDQEDDKGNASPVPSFVTENRPMEEVPENAENTEILGKEDDVVVEIKRRLKPDEDLDHRDVRIEHVEHDRSSTSSNSSSDDESRDSEKKLKDETCDSIAEPTVNSDEGKPASSLHEEVVQITDNVSSGLDEADSVSAAETAFVGDVVKPVLSMPEEVNPSIENASLNNSVVSDAVELGMKENEEKLLPINDGVNGAQSDGNKEKMLPRSSGLTAQTSNVTENTQDSKIPGYTEKQPLVAPTPPVVQRTSWLGCCGLFEVLSGSDR
ncbi:hypothetical protein SLEP1_g7807 [Rubroshorea leprosula]|uniref:Uncharacterized protein n=1 Tax=Rubroshorea leprosula TaxID=152421 RepID=A0AAV5I8P4_9ROSI|nr:hypothetical protein SLEP1_g7807 [Rubroshorea leprosula]